MAPKEKKEEVKSENEALLALIEQQREELRKEREAFMAELEAFKAEKVAVKEVKASKPADDTKAANDYMRQRVTVRLFKDSGKYKGDVTVGVNGVFYKIKRGVNVSVPRFVAEILNQSYEQDLLAANMVDQLEEEYEADAKDVLEG